MNTVTKQFGLNQQAYNTKSINQLRNIVGTYNGQKRIVDPNGNPFWCVIYLYTTAMYKKHGWVKVGSARRAAPSPYDAALIRINEQETAKNAVDPIQILQVIDVTPDCMDTDTYDYHVEFSKLRTLEQTWLHARMTKMGMWVNTKSKSSEWFYDPNTKDVHDVVKVVNSLINQYRIGVYRQHSYKMREEQQECHDQIMSQFKKGHKEFLLNGKMRFGKTLTALEVAKSLQEWLGRKIKVLIVTSKPEVHHSWQEDCETHVDFENFSYHCSKIIKDKNEVIELKGEKDVDVLVTSFQDLGDYGKKKWARVFKKYHFDYVIVDESHYGSHTPRSRKVLEKISHDYRLNTSGTPIKELMTGMHLECNIFTYGYLQEQRKRLQEELSGWKTSVYRWLPPMEFHRFDICPEAKEQLSYYTEDEAFSFRKLLKADEDTNKFIDEGSVKMFLDQYLGRLGHKNNSPMRVFNADHQLWMLTQSVASARALRDLLIQMIGDQYHIILAAGDGPDAITDVKDLRNIINAHKKTITLSVGRFDTGVSIPKWSLVAMLTDLSAPETYLQTIFRVQTPWEEGNKEKCVVVDFNRNRCLNAIYEYVCYTRDKNQSISGALREMLDFAPIMDHSGNTIKKLDFNDIISGIPTESLSVGRFGNIANINTKNFAAVSSLFDKYEKMSHETFAMDVDNPDPDLHRGRTYAPQSRGKSEIDLEKKEWKDRIKKVQTALMLLPGLLLVEPTKRYAGLIDLVQNVDPVLFETMMEMPLSTFRAVVESGVFNLKNVDGCIEGFYLMMDE